MDDIRNKIINELLSIFPISDLKNLANYYGNPSNLKKKRELIDLLGEKMKVPDFGVKEL